MVPPVMSPIVAEVYGPDYQGQIAVAKEVRKVLESTPDLVGIDDSVQADAKKTDANSCKGKGFVAAPAAALWSPMRSRSATAGSASTSGVLNSRALCLMSSPLLRRWVMASR